MSKNVEQSNQSGNNKYVDKSKITNIPVNIPDKGLGNILLIVLVIIALFLIIWITPGIIIASIFDYFFYLSDIKLWAISIIISLIFLFTIKKFTDIWKRALMKYVGLSLVSTLIIAMSYVFGDFTPPVKSVYKMFFQEEKIPYKFRQSPGDISYLASFNEEPNFNIKDIYGIWYATKAKMTFDESGKLSYEWYETKEVETGTWKLSKGVLITNFESFSQLYWITKFDKNSFDFKSIFNEGTYQANRKVRTNSAPKPKQESVCALNERRYGDRSGYGYFIRFYNQNNNTFDFSGKISIYSLGGKVKLQSNQIQFISGNVSGTLTLLKDCNELTGTIKPHESYSSQNIDFILR